VKGATIVSKKLTSKRKIELINKVCKHLSAGTESWRVGTIGSDLAYLVWAIADDGVVGIFEGLPYGYELRTLLKTDEKLWKQVKHYIVEI
jgi:hypothetical protein